MQFQKLGLAIVAIVSCASANAFDGTVNITGNIRHATCTIRTYSQNINVTLPEVSANTLNTTGQTSGTTPFDVVIDCPANPNGYRILFYFEQNANIENGRLKNTATTNPAQNVQIQLLHHNYSPIKLDMPWNQYKTFGFFGSGGGTIVYRYYAQYYATGAATLGAVSSTINYTIAYQ